MVAYYLTAGSLAGTKQTALDFQHVASVASAIAMDRNDVTA